MMVLNGGHVWTKAQADAAFRERHGRVEERRAARELQTQVEHAEFLAAKYRVTQEQITRVYNDLWKRFADGEFDAPIPFTLRCPTTLADVDDFVDLQDTQREAVS